VAQAGFVSNDLAAWARYGGGHGLVLVDAMPPRPTNDTNGRGSLIDTGRFSTSDVVLNLALSIYSSLCTVESG
jgi:hypothetical protein